MRGTLLYLGQRLILISITTVLVSSIVFLLLHQIPGNAFLNETRQSPQSLAADLHRFGLDLPLRQQYQNWVAGVLRGDCGKPRVNLSVHLTARLIAETCVSGDAAPLQLHVPAGLALSRGVIPVP